MTSIWCERCETWVRKGNSEPGYPHSCECGTVDQGTESTLPPPEWHVVEWPAWTDEGWEPRPVGEWPAWTDQIVASLASPEWERRERRLEEARS
jgi:hypothetical protein